MTSLDNLSDKRREQLFYYLNAEGYKLDVDIVDNVLNIPQTIYIQDNQLKMQSEANKELLIRDLTYKTMEDELKELKEGDIYLLTNLEIKTQVDNMDYNIVPYIPFEFFFIGSPNITILIKSCDPKKYLINTLCGIKKAVDSAVSYLKNNTTKYPTSSCNNVLDHINKKYFLNRFKVYKDIEDKIKNIFK